MFKDPQMKEMIRAQQKMMLDQMYGGLYKTLGLSSTDEDALKKLLLDRQMALTDVGLAAMGGSDTTPAEGDAKTVKASYDKQIQDFLGAQGYQLFQDYDQTVAERTEINLFKQSLSADTALTDQQESDLIAAMYANRKALPNSPLLNAQTGNPSQLTEDGMAEAMKVQEQLQKQNADSATAILNPAQMEQFTKFQQQMSAMQAAGMKMAAQMFGNKGASPASGSQSSAGSVNAEEPGGCWNDTASSWRYPHASVSVGSARAPSLHPSGVETARRHLGATLAPRCQLASLRPLRYALRASTRREAVSPLPSPLGSPRRTTFGSTGQRIGNSGLGTWGS